MLLGSESGSFGQRPTHFLEYLAKLRVKIAGNLLIHMGGQGGGHGEHYGALVWIRFD